MEVHENCLSSLPKESLVHVVSFLSSKEVMQLSELNSSFGQDILPLSVLHHPSGGCNVDLGASWIPVLFPHRTHSVVVTCEWRILEERRGRAAVGNEGEREGNILVVSVPVKDDPTEEVPETIEDGTIVYESPQARGQREGLTFSFPFCPSMSYYLFGHVAGGSPRLLRMSSSSIHAIIHDYDGQWIGKNYRALANKGSYLSNNDKFSFQLLRSIAGLAQQDMTPETVAWIVSLLGPNDGFTVSPPSMKALEELAVALSASNTKRSTLFNQAMTRTIGEASAIVEALRR